MPGWFRSGERIAALEAEFAARAAASHAVADRLAALESELAAQNESAGDLARQLAALADRVGALAARQEEFERRLDELAAAPPPDDRAAAIAELRASLASQAHASSLNRADVDRALAALAGRVLAQEKAARASLPEDAIGS